MTLSFNQAMKEVAKENTSYRKAAKVSWISLETWKKIKHRLLNTVSKPKRAAGKRIFAEKQRNEEEIKESL